VDRLSPIADGSLGSDSCRNVLISQENTIRYLRFQVGLMNKAGLGLTLLYVGAVLFVNGIWLLGKISDKEVSVINIMVGVLSFMIAVYLIFREPNNSAAISAGAFTLLFSFTYLWVGANQLLKADGVGLGWFCFFVSITAAFVGASSITDIGFNFALWSMLSWFAWSALWFGFFVY